MLVLNHEVLYEIITGNNIKLVGKKIDVMAFTSLGNFLCLVREFKSR